VLARRDTYEELRRAAVEALRAYESPAVWRQMIDTAARTPDLRRLIVNAADSVALSDSPTATAIGGWALALLDSAGGGQHLYAAIGLAARLRPYHAVPALVRVLATDDVWGGTAAHELVRLTGVDSAPTISPWRDEGRRAARDFWNAWWRANSTRYQVAPPNAGRRAYEAWSERVRRQQQLERQRQRDARRGD
jgi:hypothetical protein